MEEKVKEQIKFEIEVLRLCAIALLTIGGGVVSLIVDNPFSGKRNFFIAIGFILLVIVSVFLFKSINTIKNKIK